MTRQRDVRDGDRLDDETVVVRGGLPDPGPLRADAERYQSIYGEFGITVLAARSGDWISHQQVPLVRFETLTLVTVRAVRDVGFRLDPRGRNPRHFTVVCQDLDAGVDALVGCGQLNWVNPYHET